MNSVQNLKLHFSQLFKSWEKSKYNLYSDSRRNEYQETLVSLFDCLRNENFDNLNELEIIERKHILNFFFKSLEFLDSSTVNSFPFEIVYCLEHTLKDWLKDVDKYIVVTSLVNNYAGYSFDPSLALIDDYYALIKKVYNIKFEARLVQINLPKYMARDYFSNVVLYHELGHFIDLKYEISSSVSIVIKNKILAGNLNPAQINEINQYFPYNILVNGGFESFTRHLGEYVSDLFAAQYIGRTSNYYLEYNSDDLNITHPAHPSTSNRIKLAESFLNSSKSFLLEEIKNAFIGITTDKELKIRHSEIKSNNLTKLIPVDIDNSNELSSIFLLAWKTFSNEQAKIQSVNNFKFKLKPSETYSIINNLVEKSIGNYLIKTSWEKAKHVFNS